MALLFVILFSLTNIVLWTELFQMDEPSCMSKFDYDYKMLTKLIELEKQQTDIMATVRKQTQTLEELHSERINHGSTYTVWGKKTCPGNETSLVYSGYMAGAHYDHNQGSGANFLCLTSDPIWENYDDEYDSGGRIYGTEYEFRGHTAMISKLLGDNVYNKDVPCALCHITRGSTIMIPGRNECFGGWTKEYSGYLVCDHHTHKQASEYVCLHRSVDVLDNNEANDNERLLYFVEGVCGKSLPCPPYVNGRELTCVVCSL